MSLCNFLGSKNGTYPTKYAPSILPLLIIPSIRHSKSHFLPLVLNEKKKVLIC